MVQLKASKAATTASATLSFQFQYGTIKRRSIVIVKMQHTVFQFQYGTIKSVGWRFLLSLTRLFQFQYGTIKR